MRKSVVGEVRAQVAGWAIAVLLVSVANPAVASDAGTVHNHWGSNWGHWCTEGAGNQAQCIANNGIHTIDYYQLTQAMMDATNWALDTQYEPLANIETHISDDPSIVDVVVKDVDYEDNGWWGWTKCSTDPDTVYGGSPDDHTRWCRPQVLFYNIFHNTPSEFGTEYRRKWLACHEVGHTLGLRHRDSATTCMEEWDGDGPNTLAGHEQTQLEGSY